MSLKSSSFILNQFVLRCVSIHILEQLARASYDTLRVFCLLTLPTMRFKNSFESDPYFLSSQEDPTLGARIGRRTRFVSFHCLLEQRARIDARLTRLGFGP